MQASERMVAVRISYKKLWMLLLERDIKKASLRHEVGLSAGTWTKLNKGEEVSLSILLRICDYLNCDIGDISFVIYVSSAPPLSAITGK